MPTAVPQEWADFGFWFGLVASAVTLIAGAIAIAGVVWAFNSRAKLEVRPILTSPHIPTRLTFAITSIGSNPVRDVKLTFASLDRSGFSMAGGDGLRATLSRGETLLVDGYQAGTVSFGSEPREGEFRWPFAAGEGWFVTVQWQSPLFPWTHRSSTHVWSPQRRYASELPEVLRGRTELSFLKRTRDPSLNPLTPGFTPPTTNAPELISANDTNFDELLSTHEGPVVVGFGPTWQGELWQDGRHVLGALAAAKGPGVRVLAVNVDECPELNARFDLNVVPVFKVFKGGRELHSSTGYRPLPALLDDLAAALTAG